MKSTKKALTGSIAAAILATSGLVISSNAAAEMEVSGSAAVASSYLWRGYDLGSGTPAVSGDLSVSAAGFYAGIWGSSGDTALGTEYDLYAGYGAELGPVSLDLSVWNYNYPTTEQFGNSEIDFGDVSEVILSVGVGPVAFTYYDAVAGLGDYKYYTLGAEFGQFSALVGMHDIPDCDVDCEPTHLDISYAYNDNLSFTVSQMISDESEEDDLKFIVSYSLPIGE